MVTLGVCHTEPFAPLIPSVGAKHRSRGTLRLNFGKDSSTMLKTGPSERSFTSLTVTNPEYQSFVV